MTAEFNENDEKNSIPNGPAAAAILSAGIGCFSISLLGLFGDSFPAFDHILDFYHPTGPLSGVSTVAIVIWLTTWLLLMQSWKVKTVKMGPINSISLLLLLAGFILSFPPTGKWCSIFFSHFH